MMCRFFFLSGCNASSERKLLFWSLLLIPAAAVLFVLCFGEPKNWDSAQYHGYLGWAFWGDRLSKDMMAAGFQAYQTPYLYFPFHFLIHVGASPKITVVVFALIHSSNVVLVILIGRRLVPEAGPLFSLLCGLLTFLAPVFLAGLGTSLGDSIATIPMLAAIYVLLGDDHRKVYIAGGLAGFSVALKFTLAPFVVLISLLLLKNGKGMWVWLRENLIFGLCALGIFSISYFPWGVRLYEEFGNPFFPLFNNVFQSPYFPSVAVHHSRFQPGSFFENFLFPVLVALPSFMAYLEIIAPDVRYLFFLIFIFAAIVIFFIRSERLGQLLTKRSTFIIYLLSCLFLWQLTTGNGRYGLLPLLLLGAGLPLTVYAVTPSRFGSVLSLIVAIQCFSLFMSGVPRWGNATWSEEWFSVGSESERFHRGVYLFNSNLTFASYYRNFPEGSVFIGLGGDYLAEPNSALRQELEHRIVENRDLDVYAVIKDDLRSTSSVNDLNPNERNILFESYGSFGFVPVVEECFDIRLDPGQSPTTLFTCRMRYDERVKLNYQAGLESAQNFFSVAEETCPNELSPVGSASRAGGKWVKFYAFNDLRLTLDESRVLWVTRWPSLRNAQFLRFSESQSGELSAEVLIDSCSQFLERK